MSCKQLYAMSSYAICEHETRHAQSVAIELRAKTPGRKRPFVRGDCAACSVSGDCATARLLLPGPTSQRRGALAERSSTRAYSERSRLLSTPWCLSGSPGSDTTITHIKHHTGNKNKNRNSKHGKKSNFGDQTIKHPGTKNSACTRHKHA